MSNPIIEALSNNPLFKEIAQDCGTTVRHIYTTDCFELEKYPLNNVDLLELGKKLAKDHGYKWQGLEAVDDLDDEPEYHCIYMVKTFDGVEYNLSIDLQGEIELSVRPPANQ